MEQKNACKVLVERWKELKARMPVAQTVIPGQPYKLQHISLEELIEYEDVKKKLNDECWNKLSPAEKLEINEKRFIANPKSDAT